MKKVFLILLLSNSVLAYAHNLSYGSLPISLQVERVKPTSGVGGYPRTPVAVPSVEQEGHTFYFNNVGYDLTMVLLDEDGEEAYTTSVPVGTTTVELPSTLSGSYELQLYPIDSAYYFNADINL